MSSVGPSNPDNLAKGGEPSKAVNPDKFKQKMTQVKAVEKTDPEGQAKKRKPTREEEEQLQAEQIILAPSPLLPHHHSLFESGSAQPKTGTAVGGAQSASSGSSSSGAAGGLPEYEPQEPTQEPTQSSFQGQDIQNTPNDPFIFSDDQLNPSQDSSNPSQSSSTQQPTTQQTPPNTASDKSTPETFIPEKPPLQATHHPAAIKKTAAFQKPKQTEPSNAKNKKVPSVSAHSKNSSSSGVVDTNPTEYLSKSSFEPSSYPKKPSLFTHKEQKQKDQLNSDVSATLAASQIPGTITVPFALDGVPTSPATPAGAGYLSPELHQIFQTMVGLIIVKQLTEGSGGTQTEISLNNPEYEKSLFHGLKIIMTQYKTAPGSFNIELQGNSAQNALLNTESAKLISALNDNRYNLPFTINRLEVSLKKEESDFLFKRKEMLKDPKDQK